MPASQNRAQLCRASLILQSSFSLESEEGEIEAYSTRLHNTHIESAVGRLTVGRVGLRLHMWREGGREGGGGDERDMSGNRSAPGETELAAKDDSNRKV